MPGTSSSCRASSSPTGHTTSTRTTTWSMSCSASDSPWRAVSTNSRLATGCSSSPPTRYAPRCIARLRRRIKRHKVTGYPRTAPFALWRPVSDCTRVTSDRSARAATRVVVAGDNRVLRGGSWNNNGGNARSANRRDNEPGNRNDNMGFLLAPAQASVKPSLDQMTLLPATPRRQRANALRQAGCTPPNACRRGALIACRDACSRR